MAKTLGKALGTDLNEVAALLRSKGRNGDTILAHINPEEAALLKARGGSGKPNPETGLPEFQEYADFGGDTGPSWWDKFTDTFSFGSGRDTSGQDLSQYNIEVPETPAVKTGGYYGVDTATGSYGPGGELLGTWSPDSGAYMAPQYAGQETQFGSYGPQGQLQGLYSPEQGVYTSQPQFITGGAPETPGVISAQQPPPADKGALQKFEQAVKEYPATTSALANLTKFGLGGLATIPLMRQQQRAAQNTQAMADEIAALGAPIRQQGTQMLSQAQAGQLTPEQQQRVQALRAQQNQSLARQGVTSGVAQQQAEANVQRLTQQFVANNITNALNMVNIGNNYARSAITQGYNANQQANQAANLFYQNLFAMMGGYAPRMG